MSELPGPSAVGIESVEWSGEAVGNLTVRITGRWRRRRPITSGQPTLVVEAEGRRHRYPAMPEPPSLAGTGPGLWRLSFTLPGWMALDLGRTWLQFGTVIVPLPVAVPAPGQPQPMRAETGPARPPESPRTPTPESPPPPAPEPASPHLAQPPPFPPRELPVAPPDARPDHREPARPTVAELALRMAALESELTDARAGRDELAASLADRDRSRRIAEQQAHAEHALRQDLARQLSVSAREAQRTRQAMGDLATAEERIRGLERELAESRRRSDEAEQVAAAATVARERADRERAQARPDRAPRAPAPAAESARLHFEAQLRGHRADDAVWIPAEPLTAARRGAPPEPVPERTAPPPPPADEPPPDAAAFPPLTGGEPLVGALRQELQARTAADAAIRARLIDAEARLAARVLLEQRTSAALVALRAELDTLRDAAVRERTLRAAAERRAAELERELSAQRALSRGAYDAIGELRGALDRFAAPPDRSGRPDSPAADAPMAADAPPRPPVAEPEGGLGRSIAARAPAAPPDAPAAAAVEPARLNDALSRLRETIAPQDGPAGAELAVVRTPTLLEALDRPSLERPFRRLVRSDAAAAGRLILELLPLQRVAYPHPIAYDLVLGTGAGRGCVSVTVANDAATIAVQSAPRSREGVDFQVFGEPARIARLLTAGRWRRRFSRRVARVRGRRDGLAALSALLGTPLDLTALHRAGVRLDPATAFALVASMIDPGWTARERFTLAHNQAESATTYLVVNAGRPVQVTRTAPEGRITTTLTGPGDQLLGLLSGHPVSGLTVSGDDAPLTALREWINHAQSE